MLDRTVDVLVIMSVRKIQLLCVILSIRDLYACVYRRSGVNWLGNRYISFSMLSILDFPFDNSASTYLADSSASTVHAGKCFNFEGSRSFVRAH